MKNLILNIALALTICSCSPSYQACKNKFGSDSLVSFKDSTVYRIIDLQIPADTMGGEVSLEDLLVNDYVKDSTKQKIEIKYRDGKIVYVNICKPEKIHHTDTLKIRTKITITKNFKDQSILQKVADKIKWWWWVILVALIFGVGYLKNSFKK